MNKQKELDHIARAIEACHVCKKASSGKAVPGEGNPDADIVFLGEAPGKTEAATGRPFIGRSGQLLRSLIRAAGLTEENVYITSPVKYLPDGGTPNAQQIAHGRSHLQKQLAIIQPKYVVLLGNTACKAMLEKIIPVMKEHGKIIDADSVQYIVTIHPAAVIRFPKYRSIIEEDFKKLTSLLK